METCGAYLPEEVMVGYLDSHEGVVDIIQRVTVLNEQAIVWRAEQ